MKNMNRKRSILRSQTNDLRTDQIFNEVCVISLIIGRGLNPLSIFDFLTDFDRTCKVTEAVIWIWPADVSAFD